MNSIVSMPEIAPGERGRIVGLLPEGKLNRRLMDLGFTAGACVTCLFSARRWMHRMAGSSRVFSTKMGLSVKRQLSESLSRPLSACAAVSQALKTVTVVR